MKKSLVALAALGAFSGLAQADNTSVTLYGIVDAGFMSVSKSCTNAICAGSNGSATGSTTGSVLGFQDAQILPSIYGIKATEDLGGGLRAGFNLEGGFSTANGTHNSPGVLQSQVFGREAKVTLGGDWGTVGAGMQVDPGLIAAISTEPRGMTDSLSSLEYWIHTSGGNQDQTLAGGIFDVNSLSYTWSGNGLYLGLLYGFGGVAGSTSAGRETSIGATYSISGFVISGSYAKSNNTDPTNVQTVDTIDAIGVGYTFGAFAVRAQYNEFKQNYNSAGTALDDTKGFGIGGDWSAGANKLNLSYYRYKDDGAGPAVTVLTGVGAIPFGPTGGKTSEIALLDTYGLSKRTSIYGQIASVKADNNAGESADIGGVYTPGGLAAVAGSSTLYIGVGVQHTF
jgi:predicted porin